MAWFLGGSFETRIYRWHQSIIRDLEAKSREELGEESGHEEERTTTLEATGRKLETSIGGIHQCLWIVVTQRNIISKEFGSMIV